MVDTQQKFREEFKDYWLTVTSCSGFEGNKKDEKLLLLEALHDDGHIPTEKYDIFYKRIEQGRL